MGNAAHSQAEFPTSCSTERMAKAAPLYTHPEQDVNSHVAVCKSTSVMTHILHLLLFHKRVCCETAVPINITFCGATVQGFLRVPNPASSQGGTWEPQYPVVNRLEGTSGCHLA